MLAPVTARAYCISFRVFQSGMWYNTCKRVSGATGRSCPDSVMWCWHVVLAARAKGVSSVLSSSLEEMVGLCVVREHGLEVVVNKVSIIAHVWPVV